MTRCVIRLVKSGRVVNVGVANRVTVNKDASHRLFDDLSSSDAPSDVVEVRLEPGVYPESCDPFIKTPGSVVLLNDVTLPAGQTRIIRAFLCDAPRIRENATLAVTPAAAILDKKATFSNLAVLLPNYRLELTLTSSPDMADVTIRGGTVVAKAVAVGEVGPPRPRSLYLRQLVRHLSSIASTLLNNVAVTSDDSNIRMESDSNSSVVTFRDILALVRVFPSRCPTLLQFLTSAADSRNLNAADISGDLEKFFGNLRVEPEIVPGPDHQPPDDERRLNLFVALGDQVSQFFLFPSIGLRQFLGGSSVPGDKG